MTHPRLVRLAVAARPRPAAAPIRPQLLMRRNRQRSFPPSSAFASPRSTSCFDASAWPSPQLDSRALLNKHPGPVPYGTGPFLLTRTPFTACSADTHRDFVEPGTNGDRARPHTIISVETRITFEEYNWHRRLLHYEGESRTMTAEEVSTISSVPADAPTAARPGSLALDILAL